MKRYSIIIAILLSFIFLVLNGGSYYWQQISQLAGPIFMTITFIFWLCLFGLLIYFSKNAVDSKQSLNSKKFIPAYIYLFTLVIAFISPKWIYANHYLSTIKYRGCYEGTMNTATIFFRESGEFEYRHIGFFGETTFEKGNWKKYGDTLEISFKNDIPHFVGDKLLMTRNDFIRIHNDTLNCEDRRIYRGHCRGEN